MDTITQITLGAAVGEAVLGKKAGNRAALWGAVGGLIPDLDILAYPLLDATARMGFHRSVTHSILFTAIVGPLLGYVVWRIYKRRQVTFKEWSVLILLALGTHWLLDCFTTYGTQIFWPFSSYLVAWNSIFIIDPFYSIPFAISVLVVLFLKRESRLRRIVGIVGLVLSTSYLALGITTKLIAGNQFEQALERQGISYNRYMTTPTPINILLWSAVVETDNGYWQGFYSVLDDDGDIRFRFTPSNHDLLAPYRGQEIVETLLWRCRGYYTVSPPDENGNLALANMIFGGVESLVDSNAQSTFSYHIVVDPNSRDVEIRRMNRPRRLPDGFLGILFRRVLGEREAVSSGMADSDSKYHG